MKTKMIGIVGGLLVFATAASAAHVEDCFPTSAAWGTFIPWEVGGRTFYQEERGAPSWHLIPGSGLLFGPDEDGDGVPELLKGDGTWIYEESNGLPGLQRGGIGLLGDWFPPGCDYNPRWDVLDGTLPCALIGEDPINDETCHAGPDTIVVGGKTWTPWLSLPISPAGGP